MRNHTLDVNRAQATHFLTWRSSLSHQPATIASLGRPPSPTPPCVAPTAGANSSPSWRSESSSGDSQPSDPAGLYLAIPGHRMGARWADVHHAACQRRCPTRREQGRTSRNKTRSTAHHYTPLHYSSTAPTLHCTTQLRQGVLGCMLPHTHTHTCMHTMQHTYTHKAFKEASLVR